MAQNQDSSRENVLRSARLYVLLTQAHCRIRILDAVHQVIRGGADVVQLRETEAGDREILRHARELRRITANAGVGFIVNDRPDIARLARADGVHLGQKDLPPAAARKLLAESQILGISTHSVEQVRRASEEGAEYISVGPIFPTPTKGYEQGVGVEYIRAASEATDAPLVAIGGITVDRIQQVLSAAPGRQVIIAVCSAILGAEDIEAATASFKDAIQRHLFLLGA